MPDSALAFLIDECLHHSLVEVAQENGFLAFHVDRLGLKGARDWQLLQRATLHHLTVVTNNAIDFRRLYSRAAIHPGLVLILPMVNPERQRALFRAVLQDLAGRTDLINRIIEVDQTGDAFIFREFELPGL